MAGPKRAKTKECEHEGIHYGYAESEANPFLGRYYVPQLQPDGTTKSRAVRRKFATEQERDKWADEVARQRSELGQQPAALKPGRLRRWELADAMLEADEDPVAIVQHWRETHPRKTADAPTVARILRLYIDAMQLDPTWEESAHKSHIDRFTRRWGELTIGELADAADDVGRWIERMDFAPYTKRNQKSRVSAAFSWAKRQGHITVNPLTGVSVRWKDRDGERAPIGIMPVDDVVQLFKANFDHPGTCAKLAAGLQGGMRSSAVSRLEHADLRFSFKAVDTPAWKTKTGSRDLIQGWPPVVWRWIARAKPEDFAPPCPNWKDKAIRTKWKKAVGKQWMHEKAAALKRAGLLITRDDAICREGAAAPLHPPHNWARHTFGTCHATAFQDLPLTSALMSHAETVDTLRKHYLGTIEKPEAERFFHVTPRLIARLLA